MKQNDFIISHMKICDLESIKEILESDFDNFWNYQIFKSELQNPNSTYFIVKNHDEIVGFAGVLVVLDEADITNIVVKKSFRGNGISNLLIEKLIAFCFEKKIVKIHLEVCSANTIAVNLYKKYGFKQVGFRKKYYNDGDGLLFTKSLQN